MKNKIIVGLLVVLVIGLIGFMSTQGKTDDTKITEENKISAIVYKSPTCGCCTVYASYMDKLGYEIEIRDVEDLNSVKEELGVPYELGSCHTMKIGGYVVEGHIPEEAVQKLLNEKPDIKGIGMAGMPSGSPGMPGPKNEDFVIYEINHDGTVGDIFMTI